MFSIPLFDIIWFLDHPYEVGREGVNNINSIDTEMEAHCPDLHSVP